MDKGRLTRKLNSVGKEAFVDHYYLFKDYANNKLTKDSAIQKLVGVGRSNEEGASIRLGNAKTIFTENGNCEALLSTTSSQSMSRNVIYFYR
jgi:hypothetical protein